MNAEHVLQSAVDYFSMRSFTTIEFNIISITIFSVFSIQTIFKTFRQFIRRHELLRLYILFRRIDVRRCRDNILPSSILSTSEHVNSPRMRTILQARSFRGLGRQLNISSYLSEWWRLHIFVYRLFLNHCFFYCFQMLVFELISAVVICAQTIKRLITVGRFRIVLSPNLYFFNIFVACYIMFFITLNSKNQSMWAQLDIVASSSYQSHYDVFNAWSWAVHMNHAGYHSTMFIQDIVAPCLYRIS